MRHEAPYEEGSILADEAVPEHDADCAGGALSLGNAPSGAKADTSITFTRTTFTNNHADTSSSDDFEITSKTTITYPCPPDATPSRLGPSSFSCGLAGDHTHWSYTLPTSCGDL